MFYRFSLFFFCLTIPSAFAALDEADICDEKIFTEENVQPEIKNNPHKEINFVHYDVRDLIGEIKNSEIFLESLVDLIKETVQPNTWNKNHKYTIRTNKGTIVVSQTRSAQKDIQNLLDLIRKINKLQGKTSKP